LARIGGTPRPEPSPSSREIPIDADLGEGIGVHVDVRIDGRSAVAHSLTVTSDAGVSSTLLRDIEVRNIVATGIVSSMFHAKVEADSAIVLAPLERGVTDHDEVRRLVQELVGYSPELLEEGS
jgi:hypothetical protein